MKHQALFTQKVKSNKIKCCLLQVLFGALRVNIKTQSYLRLHKLEIDAFD